MNRFLLCAALGECISRLGEQLKHTALENPEMWEFVDRVPSLSDRSVHVWRTERASEIPADWRTMLSCDEVARADTMLSTSRRCEFVQTRVWLRHLLRAYLCCDARDVEITLAPGGKPLLGGVRSAPMHFNVSHAGRIAVAIFSRSGAVGIDLEDSRRELDVALLSRHYFTAAQRNAMDGLSGRSQRQAFFRLWTRQEARLKASGRGLAGMLDDASIAEEDSACITDLAMEAPYIGAFATNPLAAPPELRFLSL